MRTKFAFLSALFLLLVGQVVFAQVTGTVQDASNFPVSDAEVTVRGGEASTTTDENGKFSIDAKVGDVLIVVDPMGTSQDFNVTKNNLGLLKFGSAVELDVVEIRSVFNPTEKIQSGSSIVGAEKLENLNPSTSIDEMLQGKASGVFSVSQNGGPGSVANINVRGAISLTGGLRAPLYVVDGTYMAEDDVIAINPNDVEEIKILKEASQTAVYGARGANGVVIIKTKTAKRGTSQMSYKSRNGFGEMVPLSNINLMNAQQLLTHENNLFQLVNPVSGAAAGVGVQHSPERMTEWAQNDHKWADDLFQTSYLTSHHFSVQSSSDKSATNLSIGYDNNTGTVKHYKGFERISATIGNRTEVRDWMRYGFNLSGAYSTMDEPRDRRNGQSPFAAALMYRPYAPVYLTDADGNYILDAYGDPVYNTTTIPTGLGGYPTLDELQYSNREERNLRIFGSAFIDVNLLKNVTARTSFGATYDRFVVENFLQPRALLNSLLEVNPNGTKRDTSDDRLDYNWRNEITYANSWGNHNFSVTAASEYVKENFYRIFLSSQNYPNNFQNVQSLGLTILSESNTARWMITRFGYLGYLSYDYNKKYFVDAYFRRDGTSLVGDDNKYGNFWGASVGWDIAKEDFLAGSTNINNLSLRASYGEVGDDGVLAPYQNRNLILSPTATNTTWGVNYGGNPYVFVSPNVVNPQMTWENVRKMNLGVEFSLLKHRLRGKFDYFQEYKTDFLFDNFLSPTMGGFSQTINAGEFVNKGYEVELNYDLFPRQSEFQLALFANFTHLQYEVTDLNGLDEFQVPQFEGMTLSHTEGRSPYTWKAVRYAGVNQSNGEALYYDIDGNITNVYNPDDAVFTDKSPLPDMYGGFGLNASYKGFDIAADFTYTMGNYIYNLTRMWLIDPILIDGNRDTYAANYWQNPGDSNVLPTPSSLGYFGSDMFLEKGDYLRFRSLTFGYTFDPKLFERLPVNGVRVYLQGQNLALWTKFRGNPVVGDGSREDFAVGTSQYVSGAYSAFAYPQVRTFAFGINVNF